MADEVKPRKLKFGLNIRINANLMDRRSRDREWKQKDIQKRRFLAWKFINSPIIQKPLDVLSWKLDTKWVLMNALWKPSLGAPGHVTRISQAENGQKVDENEPIYLDNYWYWWKMIFKHTINHLSFVMCVYPNLNTIFLVLHLFFSPAIYF